MKVMFEEKWSAMAWKAALRLADSMVDSSDMVVEGKGGCLGFGERGGCRVVFVQLYERCQWLESLYRLITICWDRGSSFCESIGPDIRAVGEG